jgi:hypothetical protein
MFYRGKSRRFFNDRPSLEVDENTARSDVSKVSSKELLYTAIGGVLFLFPPQLIFRSLYRNGFAQP